LIPDQNVSFIRSSKTSVRKPDDSHSGPDGADSLELSSVGIVVIVCTPAYAAKGNKRDGGVGYEAMIVTSQLARNILQDKFIPVLRSGEWDDSAVPIWLQSKIGVDLRGDPYDRKQYDILIQGLHKAHDVAPPVGPRPIFAANKGDIVDNAVSVLLEQEGEPTTGSLAIATNPSSDEPLQSPIAYAWYEKKGTARSDSGLCSTYRGSIVQIRHLVRRNPERNRISGCPEISGLRFGTSPKGLHPDADFQRLRRPRVSICLNVAASRFTSAIFVCKS
jgi:hypothetical protein